MMTTKNNAPVVAASELSDEQIEALWNEHASTGYLTMGALQFARAVLAAATPAASEQAMWQALEKLASAWDGVKWDEGDDVGATIRHDFAMYAKEFAAAPAVQQPAEGGWIANTGVQPVSGSERVDVIMRDGFRATDRATLYAWHIDGEDDDIVRWRPAAPTQAEGQGHE